MLVFSYGQLILSTFSTQQNFSPLFFFLVRIWVKLVQGGRCVSHHRQLQHLVKKISNASFFAEAHCRRKKEIQRNLQLTYLFQGKSIALSLYLWPDLVLKPRNVLQKNVFAGMLTDFCSALKSESGLVT